MLEHPLWVAGGVALLVLLVPRVTAHRRHTAARQQARQRAAERMSEPAGSGGTLRALLTVGALLLRDPARMRAAVQFAGSAWQWLQRRRQARVTVTATPAGYAAPTPRNTTEFSGTRPH